MMTNLMFTRVETNHSHSELQRHSRVPKGLFRSILLQSGIKNFWLSVSIAWKCETLNLPEHSRRASASVHWGTQPKYETPPAVPATWASRPAAWSSSSHSVISALSMPFLRRRATTLFFLSLKTYFQNEIDSSDKMSLEERIEHE